jgi:hypothetical protein
LLGDVGFGGRGGGMYNHRSSPKLSDCTFSGNYSSSDGGGVHNRAYSATVLTNCVFIRNSGRDGGGMYNDSSSPMLSNCRFEMNAPGGGIFSKSSNLSLSNCAFIANSAALGGGMYNYRSGVTLRKCTFKDNVATQGGGGAVRSSESNISSTNCIFSGNRAEKNIGGALYSVRNYQEATNCTFAGNRAGFKGGCIGNYLNSTDVLNNCILWSNEAPEGPEIALFGTSSGSESSSIEVSHSVVMGGSGAVYVEPNCFLNWGEGNIDSDPLFAELGYWDPNGTSEDPNDDFWVDGDYHLRSQAGRYDPNSKSWVQDDATSPCIDAGDPNIPIGDEPFPNGGVINMGAYGGTAEASKSYFGGPVCQTIITGDINGDCKVDFEDFRLMANHWLQGI